MTLRRRLTWVVAAVALVVVVVSATAAWLTARSVLRDNVDDALRAQAQVVRDAKPSRGGLMLQARDGSDRLLLLPAPPARQGGPAEYAQTIAADGTIITTRGDLLLPVTPVDLAAIAARRLPAPRDVWIGDAHVRMMTVPLSGTAAARFDAFAVQIARPLNGVDRTLSTLWLVLIVVGALLVLAAVLAASAITRRVLRPVADLEAAAAHVEATGDLDARIAVRHDDELGALTRRFNGMLDRLQGYRHDLRRSVGDQRNLIADASHELRTPVTSLAMNAELLLEEDAFPPEERRQMLADVRDQSLRLSRLVTDLIELARGDEPDPRPDEPVELDVLVGESLAAARRDHRAVAFREQLAPLTVAGRPERLARAVANLLNNAALHGTVDGAGTVEVSLRDEDGTAVLRVADHGPGVPEAERERVFDRFRRGDGARSRPGSGLGLAIVRQVAESHGGSVAVEPTPGGGATFVLRVPVADPDRL